MTRVRQPPLPDRLPSLVVNERFGRIVNWHPMLLSDVGVGATADLARTWARGTLINGAGANDRAYVMPSDRPGSGAHLQLGVPGATGTTSQYPEFRIPIESSLASQMVGSRSLAFWVRQDTTASDGAIGLFRSLATTGELDRVWGTWRIISGALWGSWQFEDEAIPNWDPGNVVTNYAWVLYRWQHITLTYDVSSITLRLYINGSLQQTIGEAAARSYPTTYGDLVFGGQPLRNNRMALSFADIAQFTTCLDAARVRAWYEDSLRGHPIALGLPTSRRSIFSGFAPAGGGGGDGAPARSLIGVRRGIVGIEQQRGSRK